MGSLLVLPQQRELQFSVRDARRGVLVRYDYHDLYEAQFEELAVAICAELLGSGVQPFSKGPDGGRDGRFTGTARRFPSEVRPLSGKFIIQAKHTDHPAAKFSDADFSGTAATSVLSTELPRIKALVSGKNLDHYLLFANRRLAGGADTEIRERIVKETGAATVELFGIERIDAILKLYAGVVSAIKLAAFDAPLHVTPDDLAAVIVSVARVRDTFDAAAREAAKIERVPFATKNEINKLTPAYADFIKRQYLPQFAALHRFLANPLNAAVLEKYEEAVAEFQGKILAHRSDYDVFDHVFSRLLSLLYKRDGDLAGNKRITQLVLYYMYWNCDIGLTPAGASC